MKPAKRRAVVRWDRQKQSYVIDGPLGCLMAHPLREACRRWAIAHGYSVTVQPRRADA